MKEEICKKRRRRRRRRRYERGDIQEEEEMEISKRMRRKMKRCGVEMEP